MGVAIENAPQRASLAFGLDDLPGLWWVAHRLIAVAVTGFASQELCLLLKAGTFAISDAFSNNLSHDASFDWQSSTPFSRSRVCTLMVSAGLCEASPQSLPRTLLLSPRPRTIVVTEQERSYAFSAGTRYRQVVFRRAVVLTDATSIGFRTHFEKTVLLALIAAAHPFMPFRIEVSGLRRSQMLTAKPLTLPPLKTSRDSRRKAAASATILDHFSDVKDFFAEQAKELKPGIGILMQQTQ